MVYLSDFQILRPPHEASQEAILEWVALTHAQSQHPSCEVDASFHQDLRARLFKMGLGPEKIQKRGTYLTDVFCPEMEKRTLFDLRQNPTGKGLKERTELFSARVNELFDQFYPEGCQAPSHMIHITCTGYAAPSGAQHLVSRRGFGDKTVVTHAYHMGCYASIPAIRMAKDALHSGSDTVDLVHTELCTLHMNPTLHSSEQLVVQSLFADGSIKYTASQKKGPLKVLGVHEEIFPDTLAHMSWVCEDWGMRMTIAKEVPVILRRALPSFVNTLLQKAKVSNNEPMLFAIHPGGPKIIDQIKESLGLSSEQVFHSQAVLQEFGNMSSATLPYVWDKMVRDKAVKPNTHIVSLTFGPGLTGCGAVFQKGG